jgi:hypothetical protein
MANASPLSRVVEQGTQWYCAECGKVAAPTHMRVVTVTIDCNVTIWGRGLRAAASTTGRQSMSLYHKDCFGQWHLREYGTRPRLRRMFLPRMYEDRCGAEHHVPVAEPAAACSIT